jgi:hypothetical protein
VASRLGFSKALSISAMNLETSVRVFLVGTNQHSRKNCETVPREPEEYITDEGLRAVFEGQGKWREETRRLKNS